MSRPLYLALSPYHLVTREAPAMAALILGTQVVTLLPAPASGRGRSEVRAAVDRSPRLLRLMDAWRWSGPLWEAGVIGSAFAGEEAARILGEVYDDIRREESLRPIRRLVSRWPAPEEDEPEAAAAKREAAFLDGLAGDMLKGGPDPGVNIPVTAALDRFAAARGIVAVRAATASVAQRAESRLGRKVATVAIPILVQSGAGRIIELRMELRRELAALRGAMAAVLGVSRAADTAELRGRAAAYAAAFERWAKRPVGADDEQGQRIISGYITLVLETLPADAALRCGRVAVRAMAGAGAGSRGRGGGEAGSGAEAGISAGTAPELGAIVVREMAARPA